MTVPKQQAGVRFEELVIVGAFFVIWRRVGSSHNVLVVLVGAVDVRLAVGQAWEFWWMAVVCLLEGW